MKHSNAAGSVATLRGLRLKRIMILTLLFVGMFNSQVFGTADPKLPDKKFRLLSQAFYYGEEMPSRYSSTKKGQNISPPLNWVNPPKGTKSFTLIVDDPDIPLGFIFTHWLICNIPAEKQGLLENVPHQVSFKDGTVQGKNGYKKNEYYGPNPVWGRHRYYFTIYALDTTINFDSTLNKKKLMQAMKGHILDRAQLMGYFSKR